MIEEPGPQAPKWALIVAGICCCLLALPFAGMSIPQIVSPRARGDMQGGLAGMGIAALLGVTGLVLIFRQKMPPSLRKVFHLVFGALAVLIGCGLIVWLLLIWFGAVKVEKTIVPKFVSFPVGMIVVGLYWLKQGFRKTV